MSQDIPTPGSRAKTNTAASLVRSSAAEYLTFVAASGNSEASVEMRYEDENAWLTQKMMATLYDVSVSVSAINQHPKRIFSHNELEETSVVKQYLTTAADGKGYQTKHCGLQAIIQRLNPAIPQSRGLVALLLSGDLSVADAQKVGHNPARQPA